MSSGQSNFHMKMHRPAAKNDPSYSPGGANVHPHLKMVPALFSIIQTHYPTLDTVDNDDVSDWYVVVSCFWTI